MRSLAVVAAACAAALAAANEPHRWAQWADWAAGIPSLSQPEIAIVDPNKTYTVKLECAGCPFALIDRANTEVFWEQLPRENALRLEFEIKTLDGHSSPSLLLNGRSILPLEPMPLYLNARQVPANISTNDMTMIWLDPSRLTSLSMPLQYEHTVLRTKEPGQFWVQFDVTGLPLKEINDPRFPFLEGEPFKLDGEDRKMVQLLLTEERETNELFIDDIQVVARKDRMQPYRMKCGRLAMVQTAFDPMEWDKYGRIGTYERLWNIAIGKDGTWSGYYQDNVLKISLVLLVVMGFVVVRRHFHLRRHAQDSIKDDAEVALLSSEHDDAPPAYADISIPEIKIEEYD